MVPTCLHIPEQHYSVISNPTSQFSDKAAVSTIAKAATCNHLPAKASRELQDLYLGVGEVTGRLAGTGAVNIAWSPLSSF